MAITLPESQRFPLLILLLPLVFHSLEHAFKHISTVCYKSLHMSFLASNFSGNLDFVSIKGFRGSGHATKAVRVQGVSGCCSVSCGLVFAGPVRSTELDLMILRSDFHLERFHDEDQ